jgi:hypothetical protein
MVYSQLGLLAVFGWLWQAYRGGSVGPLIMQVAVAMLGMLASIGFRAELRTGTTCLECHKQKVKILEEQLFGQSEGFMFRGNLNRRIMHRFAPWCGLVLWAVLGILAIVFILIHTPTSAT